MTIAIPPSPCRRALRGLRLCGLLPLAACSPGMLSPLGPVGAGDTTILLDALVIMLAIAVPTIVAAFWVAWRYRSGNNQAE